jgi:hypothetical protein
MPATAPGAQLLGAIGLGVTEVVLRPACSG